MLLSVLAASECAGRAALIAISGRPRKAAKCQFCLAEPLVQPCGIGGQSKSGLPQQGDWRCCGWQKCHPLLKVGGWEKCARRQLRRVPARRRGRGAARRGRFGSLVTDGGDRWSTAITNASVCGPISRGRRSDAGGPTKRCRGVSLDASKGIEVRTGPFFDAVVSITVRSTRAEDSVSRTS